MPKVKDVLGEFQLPPLQQKIYAYLQQHKDEVYSYMDAEELSNLIKHNGSPRGVAFALWALDKKGMLDKERMGRRVYFGSREAIKQIRDKKKD